MTETPETLLLRPDEVARELALSTSKVYQMLAANELPALRIGTAVRVPRAALVEWIEQQVRGGAPRLEVLSG